MPRRGFAIDDGERNLRIRCVAAAIFNEFGEPVGGVSISGPTVRLPDNILPERSKLVMRARNAITAAIGGVR